jgi:8-oxo-dGTP pyrophosphatase MutT (NUDIX family)
MDDPHRVRDLIPRPSARVLLLDPRDRLLLLCYRSPRSNTRWWITVGGGLEPGETYEEGALRELREETGIEGAGLGPHVWTYDHVILDLQGRDLLMRERFFVARAPSSRIDTSGWDQVEREVLIEHRWWSLDELRSATESFGPDEMFAPPGLADLIDPILRGEIPDEPIVLTASG